MLEIKKAVQLPSIYKTLLFFLLFGCTIPSFEDIEYYYMLNVIKFNASTISLLRLLGFVTLFFGTMLYNKHFKEVEIRKLMVLSLLLIMASCLLTLALVFRVNLLLGIPDLVYLVLTSGLMDTLLLAFYQIPACVLFSKVTPKAVEATIYAFLSGIFNLTNSFLSPGIGVLLNLTFVGVTTENMDNYY